MSESLTKLILQLGVGGIFAIVILVVVFKFLKNGFGKQKNFASGTNNPRCVHMPEVRTAIDNTLLSKETTERVEDKVDDLQKDSTVQTTHLKIISDQAGKQTALLEKLVNNSKTYPFKRGSK